MSRFKMVALGLTLGLTGLAVTATNSAAADPRCEAQCRANDALCRQICKDNPCLISCEDQLRFCLEGCAAG